MTVFLLALVSILISVAAQFTLKAGMRGSPGLPEVFLQPLVLAGLGLYGLSAVCWLGVLGRWDVSKAYPMVGLGFVVAALVGLWLGEPVSPLRWAGVALICCGVMLISRS
jgi:drug/metabolite transporter (DMT)-like permease